VLSFAAVEPPSRGAKRWALFAHGVLGTKSNLRTLARRFVAQCPEWGVMLVDLPLHGESARAAAAPTVDAAAAELVALGAAATGPIEGILGHSLGGKIALAYVQERRGDLAHAWIVDACPGPRPSPREQPGSAATLVVVDALERAAASQPFADRDAFIERVTAEGLDLGLAQWLAMNVKPAASGGFELTLDLPAIRALLDDYFARDLWSVVESPPGRVRIHLVIGGRSESLDPEDRERAARAATRSPDRVSVHVLERATHWVHVDDPDGLLAVLRGAV